MDRIIDEDDGLINNSVISIVRDEYNDLLYISTQGGLSVYDTRADDFIFEAKYSNSTPDIMDIANIYGGGGAYILSRNITYPVREYRETPDSDGFLNISFPEFYGWQLLCICHTQPNLLYLGSNGHGVLEYDRSTSTLTEYNSTHGLVNDAVFDIVSGKVVSSTDWLFVGTDDGVNVFDIDAKTFRDFNSLETLGEKVVSLDFIDASNELFVGTRDGLYVFEISEANAELVATIGEAYQHGSLPNDNIHAIGFDVSSRQLYIGTNDGFYKYDYDRHGSSDPEVTQNLGGSLPDNIITAIAIDSSPAVYSGPVVYVGMQQEGVAIFIIEYGMSLPELALYIGGFCGLVAIVSYIFKMRRK